MRARYLGGTLDRLFGTSLDKGVELDELAKLPEAEREDLADRAGLRRSRLCKNGKSQAEGKAEPQCHAGTARQGLRGVHSLESQIFRSGGIGRASPADLIN